MTFQVFEETFDLIVSVESVQPVFERFSFEDHVARGVARFFALNAGAQTVEGSGGLMRGCNRTGSVGFAYGAGTAVPGDEHFACGACLLQLLLQAIKSFAKGFGLGGLIFELLDEALY